MTVNLNILSIIFSTILSMVLGAFWYSPAAFGKAWMREAGLGDYQPDKAEAIRGYLISTVSHIVGVIALAILVDLMGLKGLLSSTLAGLSVCVAFMLTSRATNYAYEGKSLSLFAINSGYNLVFYTLAGLIIGIWQ